jgi:hypothetical protein
MLMHCSGSCSGNGGVQCSWCKSYSADSCVALVQVWLHHAAVLTKSCCCRLIAAAAVVIRFVDGQKTFGVSRFDASEWPFDQPFFLETTYNVGGQLADPNVVTINSQMLIDYIRVYPANMAEPPATNVVMTAGADVSGSKGIDSTAAAPTGAVDSAAADTPSAVTPANTTVAAPPAVSSSSTTAGRNAPSQGNTTAAAVKG